MGVFFLPFLSLSPSFCLTEPFLHPIPEAWDLKPVHISRRENEVGVRGSAGAAGGPGRQGRGRGRGGGRGRVRGQHNLQVENQHTVLFTYERY